MLLIRRRICQLVLMARRHKAQFRLADRAPMVLLSLIDFGDFLP